MKKLLLFLAFFTFASIFSQTYTPLLKEGNKWWEVYWDSSGYWFYGRKKYYYFINGETTINGNTYKKLYYNLYAECLDLSDEGSCYNTNNPDVFDRLVREDVSLKKVYHSTDNGITESVIYDFSKGVGETFGNFQNNNYTIQDITYGTVFNHNVKAFRFPNDYFGSNYVYEGIGSSTGLLNGINLSFEMGNYLQCFEDTSGKSCDSQFVLGTDENAAKRNLTLYYSKETEDFKIIDNKTQDINVKFYDFTGKLLDEINTKTNQNFKLNNTYNQKILIYIISNKNGTWNGKIMF